MKHTRVSRPAADEVRAKGGSKCLVPQMIRLNKCMRNPGRRTSVGLGQFWADLTPWRVSAAR